MALTEAEWKSLIIVSVGDDSDGTLADNIDLLWESHDDISGNLPLTAALTKLDAIDLMLGQARTKVDFRTSSGSSVKLSDLFDHLLKLREATEAQIASAQTSSGGGGAIGELTTTAPIMPPSTSWPDGNDRIYRGDALRRRGGP